MRWVNCMPTGMQKAEAVQIRKNSCITSPHHAYTENIYFYLWRKNNARK